MRTEHGTGSTSLDNSGFHYDWSTSGVPAGTHTFYVVAHSSATGTTLTLVRDVTVPVAALQPRGSVSSAPGATFTYVYDGDGLLRSRSDGTTTSTFMWDTSVSPAQLVRVSTQSSGTVDLVSGLAILYSAGPSAITLARDGLGSVRVEVDSNGGVMSRHDFTAFGQSMSQSVQLLGFAGELADPSGLIYLRSRWYDPSSAIFTARDRVAGSAATPFTLNGFGYASDRPTSLTDPMGLDPSDVHDHLYAFGIGYEFLEGIDDGLHAAAVRSSGVSKALRFADSPGIRSAAARLFPRLGTISKFTRNPLVKTAGWPLVAAGSAIDVITQVADGRSVFESLVRTGLSTGLSVVGGIAGAAACGAETVATLGIGVVACPLLVIGLGAGGNLAGETIGDVIFGSAK